MLIRSDFEKLKENLTAKLNAILQQDAVLNEIAESDLISPVHGLSQPEILVLAVIAGEAYMPSHSALVSSIKRSAERAGITGMGFNVAVRRLLKKQFVIESEMWNEIDGEGYPGLGITDEGWVWIDANETHFVLARPDKSEDNIPF